MPERTDESLTRPTSPDARLADALGPAVESALKRSVRNEPHEWAEAIFPVLLPAIRMVVTSALRDMVQTLNQLLENSLSLRSWKWRWEAWRTGRPFAEIALLRTLVYRVEQVLLVDRKSGLLIASASSANVTPKDTHLISGMLTAIQEFVHDSFEVEASAGIRELHVGDFSLWVEQGPDATLAAAVRGNAPVEFRDILRAAVDLVHDECGSEIRNFTGDSNAFSARCKGILEGCLQARYEGPERPSYVKVWIFAGVIAVVLLAAIGIRWQQGRRWNHAVEALASTPGVTVTHSSRGLTTYSVAGLRDPYSDSPAAILKQQGMDLKDVSLQFQPYISLDGPLLVKRARTVLDVPRTVSASLEGDILTLRGSAPHDWMVQARSAGPRLALAGIRDVAIDGVRDQDLDSLQAEIEQTGVLFALNSDAVMPAQRDKVDTLAARMRKWLAMAHENGKDGQMEIAGFTDSSGTEEHNRGLSKERADRVARMLAAAGVPDEALAATGKGITPTENAPADASLQRRVVIRVHPDSGVRSRSGESR